GESLVDTPRQEALVNAHQLHLLAHQRQELESVHLRQTAVLALRIQGSLQEIDVVHARDLDRVLKPQEQSLVSAFLGLEAEQVAAIERHASCGDLVSRPPGEHVGEGALARAVRSHDGVHFAGRDLEVEAVQHFVAADGGVQIVDLEHGCRACHELRSAQPTAPSRLTARSAWASTANSIGSSLNTDLQKPLTIMLTASSRGIPRARQ